MRDKDFVRRGSEIQCMWKASLFCTLVMQCVYARDCHYSWCVCVSTVCRHLAAASVLGHILFFTVLAWFLFILLFRTMLAQYGLTTV